MVAAAAVGRFHRNQLYPLSAMGVSFLLYSALAFLESAGSFKKRLDQRFLDDFRLYPDRL